MPLNVLQIIPSISLVYGGPSQMVRGLSKALAAQDVNVTVITTDSNGDVDEAPLDVPLGEPVDVDGYRILHFRCAPFRRYKFSTGLLSWLWQHAHEYDVAHIHALFSPVTSMAATIARLRGLPYVLRPLGTLDPADLQKKKLLKLPYITVLERPNLKGAAAIHFTAPQEAEVSERFGLQTNDWVIPLGVMPSAPHPDAGQHIRQKFGIPEQTPIVLFMSRVDPKKGLDLLLPALEQVKESGVDFHFILCGANPQDRDYETAIANQIKTSRLAGQSTVTGFVSGDLKTQILQGSDLFVLPSYYENFGIAVAEAMWAAKPVVISNQVFIWPDIEKSESGWVVPCAVDPLVGALKDALTDGDLRQQRGENAQQFA
ncbi:MAG: hormogonium polysaccharide biosynthesis glycosyltransferase HpsP, partial [Cyanobacteria bacterium J06632_22]